MAVYLIDKIKPKNNGTFGMADTVDIDHSDGRRLDVVLDEIAEKADGGGTAVTALTKRVETAEGKIAAAENALAKKVEINDADTSATATYSSTKIEDAITAAKQAVKDELLDGAGDKFDTLKELQDAITTNKDAITALNEVAGAHIRYDQAQTITDAQKKQARDNVGAASDSDLVTGLASKLDATVLKAPAAEGEKVALSSLTAEGEYIVTSPNERPTNFSADPLLVSVRRKGSVIVQLVGGIDDSRYQLYGRIGTITAAAGDTPESITWTDFSEIGAQPDLSGYATKTELNTVKSTADAAQTAAATNASTIASVKTTVDGHTSKLSTIENQVDTNTAAIQANASDISTLRTALGASTDFVATFEAICSSKRRPSWLPHGRSARLLKKSI